MYELLLLGIAIWIVVATLALWFVVATRRRLRALENAVQELRQQLWESRSANHEAGPLTVITPRGIERRPPEKSRDDHFASGPGSGTVSTAATRSYATVVPLERPESGGALGVTYGGAEAAKVIMPVTEESAAANVHHNATVASKVNSWPNFAALRSTFAANWTGILGSIFVVLGVAFLGTLTTLLLGPIGKFSLVVGIGIAAFGASKWLRRHERWALLSTTLRAISGAIALFAAIGASGIEGMRITDNQMMAVTLLGAGIAINFIMVLRSSQERIASLHAVLNLAALAVAPSLPVVLIFASISTVGALALSYRSRWELHTITMTVAFALFHLWWHRSPANLSRESTVLGLASVLLVAVIAAMNHYRKVYKSQIVQPLACLSHVTNFALLIVNLFQYDRGSSLVSYYFLSASVVVFGMAQFAKRQGIRWLYVSDMLIGEMLILASAAFLYRFEIKAVDIALGGFGEALLFCVLTAKMLDQALLRGGYLLAWLAGIALIAMAFVFPMGLSGDEIGMRIGVAAMVSWCFMLACDRMAIRHDDTAFVEKGKEVTRRRSRSVIVLLSSVFVLVSYYFFGEPNLALPLISVVAVLYLIYRSRAETVAWNFATTVLLACVHVLVWVDLEKSSVSSEGLTHWLWNSLALALADIPLLVPRLWRSRVWRLPLASLSIYCAAFDLAIIIYKIANPVSNFVPGLAYLMLGTCCLELARHLCMRVDTRGSWQYLAHASWFYMMLFLVQHFTVHMQSQMGFVGVPVRLIIGILATFAMIHWLFAARQMVPLSASVPRPSAVIADVHALIPEFIMFVGGFSVALELPEKYYALICGSAAVFLLAKTKVLGWPERFLTYSWILFVQSLAELAFISSTLAEPSDPWFLQSSFIGVGAIAVNILYAFWSLRIGVLSLEAHFPHGIQWCGRVVKKAVSLGAESITVYPLLVAIGIFLYWRYDSAVLTLLWVAEIFVAFIIGVVLKKQHFSQVANLGLIACIIRLIVFDLAQEGLFARAIVFLGVGVLMLGINAIVRKFGEQA